ncbi:toxin-antitoxin system YwqK family antitoxin [Wenyingzhuangia sp. IMCC45467]
MKKKFLLSLTILLSLKTIAQKTVKYEHCDCIEKINYLDSDSSIKNGDYELICNGKTIEKGKYSNNEKDGNWIIKTEKGIVVSDINYTNGKLDGSYKLFYFKGESKLSANFSNNLQIGEWKYYSDKGKVIKEGSFDSGKPIGIWRNYKKKKIDREYDFDKNEFLINKEIKTKKSYLPQDDETGEYIIIYYPERDVKTNYQPLEGYKKANQLFIDLINVPVTLMNTYTKYDYNVNVNLHDGIFSIKSITLENNINYNSSKPSFPYIANTNYPKNLKRISHTELLHSKMQERIFETLMVLGPWVNSKDIDFEIHVPFVLNEIK